MLSRLLVIILTVPILIYVFLSGDITFLIFNIIVIGISMYEFYTILRNKGKGVYYKTGIMLGVSLPILIYFKHDISILFRYLRIFNYKTEIAFDSGAFVIFSLMAIAILQILGSKIKNSTEELMYTLLGIIYIAFFLSYMMIIREEFHNGKIMLLYTFISIWACDTLAYIVGVLIGGKIFRTRLSEKISPKKSIEGFIGGILGVFISTYSFIYIYRKLFKADLFDKITLNEAIILSILIALFSVLGDLFESKLKREFGVKDSGTILLGHGGFLDRFDSAMFVMPVVYYFVKYVVI
ncbi:phosphatidate cytidylyltransferase [Pseudostreptobacillus sp.]